MSVGVWILTGYLGSGKTTLLLNWLKHVQSVTQNAAVIMNEMGETDIDGELVDTAGFPVKKLLDGCICCSIRGELSVGIARLIDEFAPGMIILETTGVADPSDIIYDLENHPDLRERVEVHGVITVVDGSRLVSLYAGFADRPALEMTIKNQIRHADLIVLNKLDLADEQAKAEAKRLLAEDNPSAPVTETVYGALDFARLPQRKSRQPLGKPAGQAVREARSPLSGALPRAHEHASLYDCVETFAYPFEGPVVEEKFASFLRSLPNNVYRAKGFVQFVGQSRPVMFQHTENQVEFTPCDADPPRMAAVFIGADMDKQGIIAALKMCYAAHPDETGKPAAQG